MRIGKKAAVKKIEIKIGNKISLLNSFYPNEEPQYFDNKIELLLDNEDFKNVIYKTNVNIEEKTICFFYRRKISISMTEVYVQDCFIIKNQEYDLNDFMDFILSCYPNLDFHNFTLGQVEKFC